jgi:hypothetical protein
MRQRSYPETPEEWDKLLLNIYGYGFHEFAYCLAWLLRDPRFSFQYSEDTDLPEIVVARHRNYYKDLERYIREKKKEKNTILKAENLNEETYYLYADDDLAEVLDKINKEIRLKTEELMEKPIWIKRGRPVEVKNIISSIFAQVIVRNGRTDWYTISALLEWFHKSLIGVSYQKDLAGRNRHFYYFNLRNEYYEIIKDSKKENEILRLKEFFFPISRERKPVRIAFGKHSITIDREDGRYPLIAFLGNESFKEDIKLRKVMALLNIAPKKKRKEGNEKAITIRFSKRDYDNYKKYIELTKNDVKHPIKPLRHP